MAKKLVQLTALDIILQADADTIREAYESRLKIDDLLVKREEAYRQIEAIEQQVEELVGEEGQFVYPAPPLPVAGFGTLAPASRPKPKVSKPKPESELDSETKDEPAPDTEKKDEAAPTEPETPEEDETKADEE